MAVPRRFATAKPKWLSRRSGRGLGWSVFWPSPVLASHPPNQRTHDSPSPIRTPRNFCVPASPKDCITMLEVEKPDLGHRKAAIQIVAQLPEAQVDALLILEAATQLVLTFLAEDHLPLREAVVLALVPASLASSASVDLSR
jgi:hypothetical protein